MTRPPNNPHFPGASVERKFCFTCRREVNVFHEEGVSLSCVPPATDPRTESWFSEWLNRRGLVDYRTLPFGRARAKIKEQTFALIFSDVNP